MRSTSRGEPEVWAAARAGDPRAFGEIYDEHKDRVFGQALRLTRSPHEAEDVVAMVFFEAWRRRDDVRLVGDSAIAWLLVTTNYVVRNQERTRRRHEMKLARIPAGDPSPDFSSDVDDRLDSSARDAATRHAFASLPQRDQDVLTLCVLEELSMAEASTALGVSLGTVKSRLSRAKQHLARLATRTETSFSEGGVR